MKEYCPFVVISGTPVRTGIEFNHPMQKIFVNSEVSTVWSVLRNSDGMTKKEDIVRKVARITKQDPELISDIIDDLSSLEILVDSRMAYSYLHKLGNNLSTFSTNVSPSEIAAIQSSDHTPLKSGGVITLERPGSTVGALGSKRASCRNFSDASLTKEQLSELLRVGYSTEVAAAPSAGALYPIRIYAIVVRAVDELQPGLYEYDSQTHSLTCFETEFDQQALEFALNSESLLHNAPVVLVVSAELDRQPTKYANRGYRYSLIEAGHVAQNIHLVGQELQLATLEYCGFQDNKLSEALGLVDSGIQPILTVAVGRKNEVEIESDDEFTDGLVSDLVGKGKPVNWLHLVNSPSNEEELSFFYFSSHFRSTGHDDAKLSYKDRLCGGTSTSYNLAITKAIAEGYERYQSGVIQTSYVGAADSLEGEKWLDPHVYAPYSDDQVNRLSGLAHFLSDKRWEWTEGQDVVSGEKVFVPIELVYYPLSSEKLGRDLCHYANSSGIAAHATYDAAMKGALLELIERDAIMRNWFERTAPPQIPHASLSIHWQRRIDYWRKKGYECSILDMSSNGVTVINVVIHSDEVYPHFVTGTAASIDSLEAALNKAFHEAELSLVVLREEGHKAMSAEDVLQPADHGLLYAQKEFLGSVDYLWSGCYSAANEPSQKLDSLVAAYRPTVVDLSGSHQALRVVRVFSEDLIPINFGYGVDHHTHKSLPESTRSRHFGDLEPHYLA